MINISPLTNIYELPSKFSKLSSQMLYGEKFNIISRKKKWIKIKTCFDNYQGYIQNKNFDYDFKTTHKIYRIKTKIFRKLRNRLSPTKKFLYYASRIRILKSSKKYIEYKKNYWIKKKDVKKTKHYESNFSKVMKSFLNTKYLWGGKSCAGIDCSALIQIYFYYNGIFFKRDTKDQIKFLKMVPKRNKYDKRQLIFWKGHVAYCLNKSNLIHAYGPKNRVLMMKIKDTIKEIEENSKLKVRGLRKLNVV
tara:strand:+ start:98 stop:844 length:747 start_codon:yes stop_codon:yes gene_type:complete